MNAEADLNLQSRGSYGPKECKIIIIITATPSENVYSSMSKMHRIRFITRMREVALGHLLSIDTLVMLADSEGPDQPARMRRLIWAFAVRICPKTGSLDAAQL